MSLALRYEPIGSNNMNKLIIVLILVLVLGAGYLVATQSTPSAPGATLQTSGSLTSSGADKKGFDFARALLSISSIKLDLSFSEAPAWKALQDFSVKLRTPTIGRTNPFAPIDSDFTATPGQSQTGTSTAAR